MVARTPASDLVERVAGALSVAHADAVGVVVVETTLPWHGPAPEDGVMLLDERTLAAVATSGGERAARSWAERLIEAARGSAAFAGIAVGVGGDAAAATLVDDARVAARQARDQGVGEIVVLDPRMRRRLAERRMLGGDLTRAVAQEQLRLAYQPIVSLSRGEVIGVEALLRWSHPVRGAVPAPEVLRLAAEEGLVEPIGGYVLSEAVAQLARWDAAGEDVGFLAVNVFPEQLRDPRLAGELEHMLRAAGADPVRLALEITERGVGDSALALATIEHVHRLGVRLVLDDFGTGASSLRSLRCLPLSGLKIDGSFVAGVADRPHDRHIAAAIIGMAGALGIEVIAEGVETADQARWLRRLGCGAAQGYLFARPTGPDEISTLIAGGLAARAPAAAFGPVDDPSPARRVDRDPGRTGELITLGAAADLLGVSASTARRWADAGRLRMIRTSGGHRRFARAEIERLAAGGAAVPVVRRPAAFPAGAPDVVRLLEEDGGALAVAAGGAVYEDGAAGWLVTADARAVLEQFQLEVAAAARAGGEPAADAAVRRLLDEGRKAGAGLLELDAFLGRYFALVSRALRRAGAREAELVVPRVLAANARHALLAHAEGRERPQAASASAAA